MTEKEKMLAGMIYDANNDAELENERSRAKALCHEFNSVSPTEPGRQREILRKLLGKTQGDSFTIMPSFWCDYGYNRLFRMATRQKSNACGMSIAKMSASELVGTF